MAAAITTHSAHATHGGATSHHVYSYTESTPSIPKNNASSVTPQSYTFAGGVVSR